MKILFRLLWVTLLASGGCAPAMFPEVRYIALGDSLTGTLETNTYPQFLIETLGITKEAFAAEGEGGQTTAEGFERLQEIVQFAIYPQAEVFICFLGGAEVIDFIGANDPGLAVSPSEPAYPFAEELDLLFGKVRSTMMDVLMLAGDQGWEIYIATYPALPAGKRPCHAFGGSELDDPEADRANEYVDRLNDIIVELAAEFEIALVDIRLDNEELLSDLGNYSDCIHPSDDGAVILAHRFAETIP